MSDSGRYSLSKMLSLLPPSASAGSESSATRSGAPRTDKQISPNIPWTVWGRDTWRLWLNRQSGR